jgi:hypothetical protein
VSSLIVSFRSYPVDQTQYVAADFLPQRREELPGRREILDAAVIALAALAERRATTPEQAIGYALAKEGQE